MIKLLISNICFQFLLKLFMLRQKHTNLMLMTLTCNKFQVSFQFHDYYKPYGEIEASKVDKLEKNLLLCQFNHPACILI